MLQPKRHPESPTAKRIFQNEPNPSAKMGIHRREAEHTSDHRNAVPPDYRVEVHSGFKSNFITVRDPVRSSSISIASSLYWPSIFLTDFGSNCLMRLRAASKASAWTTPCGDSRSIHERTRA